MSSAVLVLAVSEVDDPSSLYSSRVDRACMVCRERERSREKRQQVKG